jgi:hypothetical protein
MTRRVSIPLFVAVLGLGGLALAQDGLIVDPWTHPSLPSLDDAMKPSPGAKRAPERPVGVAAFPIDDGSRSPSVVPVGPPLDPRANAGAVVPMGPANRDGLVDPWAEQTRHPTDSDRRARLALAHHDWAWEIQEIVDPWAKGPVAVSTDPLIVDPWAR